MDRDTNNHASRLEERVELSKVCSENEFASLKFNVEKANQDATKLLLVTQNPAKRLKLEQVHSKIREVTSLLDGVNNVEEKRNGGVDPLTILPVELWEQILKLVTETNDLIACYSVCTLWMDEVIRQKPFLLFTEAFPQIVKYLPRDAMKQTRLVCQEWKRSMDHFLETSSGPYQLHKRQYELLLSSIPAIENLLREMENFPSATPFPGKEVQLNDIMMEPEHRGGYWQRALNFLERFGPTCNYVLFLRADDNQETLRTLIEEGLGPLSNLKGFGLMGDFSWDAHNVDIRLPDLPHLNDIALTTSERGYAFSNAILTKYGAKLRELLIKDVLLAEEWNWSRDMPFLNKVAIIITTQVNSDLQLRLGNWKLKILKIVAFTPDTRLIWKVVLMSSETLVEIEITARDMKEIPWNCGLPKLEKLTLGGYTGSFNFLLGLKSLQHLKISESQYALSGGALEIVNIVGFEERMYESNLWKLLPNLKTFKIKELSYSRDMYLYLKKMGRGGGELP